MTETNLSCPKCGHVIPLTEALTVQLSGQLETRLKSDFDARLKDAIREAESRSRAEQQIHMEVLGKQLVETTRHAREVESRELAPTPPARA